MQKKRARERIIMFLCIISLLFTPVLAASQSNAMRVSLDLKSATVKEFFDAVKEGLWRLMQSRISNGFGI